MLSLAAPSSARAGAAADQAAPSAAPGACFALPAVGDPAAYSHARFHGYTGDSTREHGLQLSKGTTTLAFKFQGGVVVSVDSRSTQGSYIGAPRPDPPPLPRGIERHC